MVSWLFGLAACDPNLAIGPADKSDGTDTADTSFDSAADTSVDDSGDTAGGVETGDSADPIVDADGDGFLASEGDCDDTRANVYPGAQDLCDSLDQDCDGEAVPSGSCSEIVQAEDAASRTIVGEGGGSFGYPISAGEVDGDGNADVWLLNNDESGGYSLLSGIELLQRGDEAEREFYTLIDEYPAYQFAGAVGAGDYNDDGYDDFWLNAQEYAPIGSTGGAFLFLGGATRWVSGERSAMDDADGYWEDDRDDYRLGGVLAGGDLTADGLADALFLGEFNDDGTLWWTLVPGTTEAPPFGASATDFPVWIELFHRGVHGRFGRRRLRRVAGQSCEYSRERQGDDDNRRRRNRNCRRCLGGRFGLRIPL